MYTSTYIYIYICIYNVKIHRILEDLGSYVGAAAVTLSFCECCLKSFPRGSIYSPLKNSGYTYLVWI